MMDSISTFPAASLTAIEMLAASRKSAPCDGDRERVLRVISGSWRKSRSATAIPLPAVRRFLLQRLAVDSRRLHYKSTRGLNQGWRRSRLGGNRGSHFYAWWAPKNALPRK
jgi:hypothetical protein